jgi:hypothetical protein
MTGQGRKPTLECSELPLDELNDGAGGVVCITHPPNPCMPTGIGDAREF